MKHPVTYIANIYRSRNWLPEETVQCMEYTLKALFNEWSKLAIYLLIFCCLRQAELFLLCYAVYVTVRLFAGGVHCRTYGRCFLVSFLFLGGCVVGAHVFLVPVLVAVLSCGVALGLSPVTPSFRMISSKKHCAWLRVGAAVIGVGWIVIAKVLCKNATLANGILITVACANYQLLIPKAMQFGKYVLKKGGKKDETVLANGR